MSRLAPIARNALTKVIVDHLVSELGSAVLVGRGAAPQAGGWSGGQPGQGTFQAYTSVRSRSALTPSPLMPNPVGRNLNSWKVGYRASCFGALESHAGDTCDRVGEALATLSGVFTLRGVNWQLQLVEFGALGEIVPNNSTDPPYWQTSVDVSLHLSHA